MTLNLQKNEYIGTAAWFFFIITLFKFPLHILSWKTITWSTLLVDVISLPVIALGAVIGIWVVTKIPSHTYRWIVVTVLSAFLMFVWCFIPVQS